MSWLLPYFFLTASAVLIADVLSGEEVSWLPIPSYFLFLGFFAFVLWAGHMFRREADPLLLFLRKAVAEPRSGAASSHESVVVSDRITLHQNEDEAKQPVTMTAIQDALLATGQGDFIILSKGPETYMQAAFQDGSYILERRDGNDRQHFRAVSRHSISAKPNVEEAFVSFEDVQKAMIAYATENPLPVHLGWQRIDV